MRKSKRQVEKMKETLSYWEREIYGSDSHKLKVTLKARPFALFEAHKGAFNKTDDEAANDLIDVGSIKYQDIWQLKEDMETLREEIKAIKEENEALRKKDAERDDFFMTWAADKGGFTALLKTKDHFDQCVTIQQTQGFQAAQRFHEDYLSKLQGIANTLGSPETKPENIN